jgi:hypothetical protein
MKMKKILLGVVLALVGTGLAFAEFEGEFGFFGGLGNSASAGLSVQLGYLSPAVKQDTEEPASLRWGILFDGGIGFRYGLWDKNYTYIAYSGASGQNEKYESPYLENRFDYNLGLTGEFYFLPFMGIAVGGGVASGANKNDMFAPYFRAEIPFLFKGVKLSLGFDYIFWNNDTLPNNVIMPPGYRANLFIRFRGEAALNVLGIFLWWIS